MFSIWFPVKFWVEWCEIRYCFVFDLFKKLAKQALDSALIL